MKTLSSVAALLLLLCGRASATWSIVVVDMNTREVAVGTATCLNNFSIVNAVPVIRVGTGAGAAQGIVSGQARKRIWVGLINGAAPRSIVAGIDLNVGADDKQFGVVDLIPQHPPVTFTGPSTGAAAGGLTGQAGSLRYAIQGNVLVSTVLNTLCEQALTQTQGDLSQKLMAAMEAARAIGGDGRCSCAPNNPTGCGAPPPNFLKSAHTAAVVVARIGDLDGTCDSGGCANGSYYLRIIENGGVGDPDPVLELQTKYDAWRAALIGRPDQVHSRVTQPAALTADGLSQSTAHFRLHDVDKNPLASGGALVTLSLLPGSPGVSTAGPVVDNGDGSYSVTFTAGTTPGTDQWRIQVFDFVSFVTLQPDLTVVVDPVSPLTAGTGTISAAGGGPLALTLDLGARAAGRPYALFGPATAGPADLVRAGRLDADGTAALVLDVAPEELAPLVGRTLEWSAAIALPSGSPLRARTSVAVAP